MAQFTIHSLLFMLFIIFGAVNSIELNCNFGIIRWGSYTGDQYACNVLNDLSVPRGGKVTSITGQHQAGKTNADVKGLQITRKNLNFIPRDIDKFFPNIIALTFVAANLTEIHEEDFKPFPNLRVLWVWMNKIEVLEENLFRYNPLLGEISFSQNKLRHISVNTFSILKPLTYLYLMENSCIDLNANTQATVPALINEARRKCFSIETAPKFETCQRNNRDLQVEIENLKKENEILMNAKTNLEELNESLEAKLDKVNKKLSKCECDNKVVEVLAKNEERFVEIEKRLIELGSSPCSQGR